MDRSLHYYAIAEQCEREAAEASLEQTRKIMLEAATQWRQLGDEVKSSESPSNALSSTAYRLTR